MPRVQSSIPVGDDLTYELTPLPRSENLPLGPPLDYFDFDQPYQPFYQYPISFPQAHPAATQFPAHVAQLYDYTALYSGQPPLDQDSQSSDMNFDLLQDDKDLVESNGEDNSLYTEPFPPRVREPLTSQTKSMAPRRPQKSGQKEDTHSTSPDESNAGRQRGRPRLDARDQTATEV